MRYFLAQSATLFDFRGLQEEIGHCFEGHWRTEHSLHATVLFLGNHFERDTIIRTVKAQPYRLERAHMAGIGRFGHNRILYAQTDHPTLVETHLALSRAFAMHASKDYVPHVTLMRYKSVENGCYRAHNTLYQGTLLGNVEGPLKLMGSTLTPQGAVYETLYEF